ncbi:MAG TPA: type I-C CRISPR-associated protein Cas8c/Csd1 [Clostridia bacterium]|nr:type I-C CRISPR-associated protein Cas8c/Csd1 [Clostridia bacterium]
MIIAALDRYYDCLANMENSPLIPDGYSKVNISYSICLTESGELKGLIPRFKKIIEKNKEKEVPLEEVFPERLEISATKANFLEHRAKYIFGFNVDKKNNCFVIDKNAEESFISFVEATEIFNEIDSPLAKAIYGFSQKWKPAEEINNPILIGNIKEFLNAKFTYCLDSDVTSFAHRDKAILEKWEEINSNQSSEHSMGYCTVIGEYLPIAKIHKNLKGIPGAMASGANIVCCKEDSSHSYGQQSGYVASISEKVMKRYTAAFNYLASSKKNKYKLGDMTLLFWAETPDRADDYAEVFAFFNGFTYNDNNAVSENLKNCMEAFAQGKLPDIDAIGLDSNTKFYILGLKPNASRLSIKLFYYNSFGKIMENVKDHLEGIRLYENQKNVPKIYQIMSETVSPKSNDEPNPALESQLITSVVKGSMYPDSLIANLIIRIKTDQDSENNPFIKINDARVGAIKGYLNRKQKTSKKGELITMALNTESKDRAYLCGRLFALLEALQKNAVGDVNSGIKSRFFGSACSTPAMVLPRLIRLSQNHINKLENHLFWEIEISGIIDAIEGDFPKTLSIEEQGRFILGYYQQNKYIYTKKEK